MSHPGEAAAPPSIWNLPNALSMLRIVLVPVFAVLLVQDTVPSRIFACAVFVAAAITDRLDGQIARKRGLITKFGTMLDTIADKVLVIAALILLSWLDEVPWWVTIVLVVRELGITLLKTMLVRRHVMAPSRGGKLKAVLQMVALSVLVVDWVGLLGETVGGWIYTAGMVILYAAVAVAVVTAVDYLLKAWRIVRDGPAPE